MNYDIDLPEELKVISKPEFKTTGNELIIVNKPSLWDIMFPSVFIIIFFVMMLNGGMAFKDSGYRDYLILAMVLMVLLLIQYVSLNKVSFDFDRKCVNIKNYNPLINVGRKMLQIPSLIMFNEIKKVYYDYQFWGKGIYKHKVILQTDSPYKYTIAIFSTEAYSTQLSAYLYRKIKAENELTAQGSDSRKTGTGQP